MTPEAFTATVLPLRDKCYRFAASILRNAQESEDVAQDVLIKLWNRRDELHLIDSLEAWAMRATRNLAIDRMRHSSWRTSDVDALYDRASQGVAPDVRTEQREAVDAVYASLSLLPDVQRAIVHLREVEQHSYAEISEALQLSVAQVKVYLHRARKKICASIDQSHSPSASPHVKRLLP